MPGALTCTESKLQQREEQKDSVLNDVKLLKFLDNDSSSWMAFPAIKGCTVSGLPSTTWDALRSSSDELTMAKPGEGDVPFTWGQGRPGWETLSKASPVLFVVKQVKLSV